MNCRNANMVRLTRTTGNVSVVCRNVNCQHQSGHETRLANLQTRTFLARGSGVFFFLFLLFTCWTDLMKDSGYISNPPVISDPSLIHAWTRSCSDSLSFRPLYFCSEEWGGISEEPLSDTWVTRASAAAEDSQLNSATIKYSAAVSGTSERVDASEKKNVSLLLKHNSSYPLSPAWFPSNQIKSVLFIQPEIAITSPQWTVNDILFP